MSQSNQNTSNQFSTKLLQALGILVLFSLFVYYSNQRSYDSAIKASLSAASHLARSQASACAANRSYTEFTMSSNQSEINPPMTSITNKSLYSLGNLKPPAVLLRFKGGIGNQLFEYACHYALARKNNWPLYIDIPLDSVTEEESKNFTKDEQLLRRDVVLKGNFEIPFFDENTFDGTWSYSGGFHIITDSQLLSGHYPKDQTIQQSGSDYCQGEAFFAPYKDEIKELFKQQIATEPIQDWIDLINSREGSVAVHLRRGDFVRLNIAIPMPYYNEAIERISKMLNTAVTFFIFTDDVDYVRKEFFGSGRDSVLNEHEMFVVSEPELSTLQEFYLMTICKHDIIPNSSFSWWAAYLNRNSNKIVFAAHHDLKLFDEAYSNDVARKEFFKFTYRHIYYPYDWYTIDTFS